MTWLRAARLLVLARDVEGYRDHCREMLLQFAESEKVGDAGKSCKVCLLLPGTVEASELPLGALETALDEGTGRGNGPELVLQVGLRHWGPGRLRRRRRRKSHRLGPPRLRRPHRPRRPSASSQGASVAPPPRFRA